MEQSAQASDPPAPSASDEPTPFRPASARPTSATANAVLGLLSFGQELSGYDLKKWADHSLSFFFWSPATSQIYGELRRLEALDYVTSRVEAKDELRGRRLYRITDEGQAWLEEWLATEPADVPILKNPAVLRVWLGHLMDPDELRGVVEDHRAWLGERLAEARADSAAARSGEGMAHAEVVIRWAERRLEAEVANADQLLDDLAGLDGRTERS
jgi:DNA-binding PadR family transcriptional regulator